MNTIYDPEVTLGIALACALIGYLAMTRVTHLMRARMLNVVGEGALFIEPDQSPLAAMQKAEARLDATYPYNRHIRPLEALIASIGCVAFAFLIAGFAPLIWGTEAILVPMIAWLLVLAYIDLKTTWMPNLFVLPLIAFVCVAQMVGLHPTQDAHPMLIGGAIGAGLPMVAGFVFKSFKGVQAYCTGDIYLFVAVGMIVGPMVTVVVLCAAVLQLIFAPLVQRISQNPECGHAAFGPSVVLSSIAVLLF